MGSRSKINLAYIAGFLDGDGSLMIQIKKRKDTKSGARIMLTICFYQDSRHAEPLIWIRRILGIGYISKRNDGITELRINGFKQIYKILKDLIPFLKFKKKQALAITRAAEILKNKKRKSRLDRKNIKKLIDCIMIVQINNYATHSKKKKRDLCKILGLTP